MAECAGFVDMCFSAQTGSKERQCHLEREKEGRQRTGESRIGWSWDGRRLSVTIQLDFRQ